MPPLLALPHEVLHCILRDVDPKDLPRISQTCHALYAFLKDNQMLSKAVYLHTMDYTPRSNAAEPIWTEEIRKIIKLEHIFSGTNIENKLRHIEFVGQTVTELLQTARAPSNPDAPELQTVNFLQHHFKSKQNQDAFLRHSELFDRARYQDRVAFVRQPFPARQASAKLHCLYGCPLENAGKPRSQRTYPYACSKVYDLRNYTQKTKWGPFMEDGSGNVDWERVEAIMVTLGYNLRRFDDRAIPSVSDVWETPFLDAIPDSYISGEIPFAKQIIEKSKENSELDAQDPYGISGTYMRIVCFLDYSDLFAYNFTHPEQPADEPRVAYDASEVVRMIKMEIKVVRIEPPGPDDHPDYPVVYFRGNSRSSGMMWDPNANSSIRGKGHVRVTKEGEVHWTSFSIYGGEERWRSEGIQVGGIRSQRGVIGNWFDKDYDIRGPAGPTAFWKISDDIEDFDPNSIPDMDDDSEDEEDDSDYELVFELGTDGLTHQSS